MQTTNSQFAQAIRFLAVFFLVMVISYGFLVMIDFVPESREDVEESTDESDTESRLSTGVAEAEASEPELPTGEAQYPVSIHIEALDKTIAVLNPQSRSISALDEALLDGVVRHPDSAHFGDPGNMFLLGHSSYLPNVLNKNFQAFNGIQKLSWGDVIRVKSPEREYIYRVERVYEAKASELVVPNSRGEERLTLATCNTFGAKEDRYIVEAVLVSTTALAK